MCLKHGDLYWYSLIEDVAEVLEDWWIVHLLKISNIQDSAFKTNSDDEELAPPGEGLTCNFLLRAARIYWNNIFPSPLMFDKLVKPLLKALLSMVFLIM